MISNICESPWLCMFVDLIIDLPTVVSDVALE